MPMFLVLPISVLTLASCGKPTAWEPSASDACHVITEQDAAEALGTDPGPGVPSIHDSVYWCSYGLPNHETLDVQILSSPGQSVSGFTDFVRSDPELKALDGIGEAAYMRLDTGSAEWYLQFVKGTYLVTVHVPLNGRESASVEQLTIGLAKSMAARL